MNQASRMQSSRQRTMSPLVLSDRLLTLAEQAERAGYIAAAHALVELAFAVLDEKLRQRAPELCVAG